MKNDRSKWGSGPWDAEPDRDEWRSHGFPCLIVRGPSGALCGYVGVTEGHPWFKADYNDVPVNVHGGLTYGDMCQEDGHICHVAQPGEPDAVFWLGFDCAHSGDLCPSYRTRGFFREHSGVYRDMSYVRAQVERLAEQAANPGPLYARDEDGCRVYPEEVS